MKRSGPTSPEPSGREFIQVPVSDRRPKTRGSLTDLADTDKVFGNDTIERFVDWHVLLDRITQEICFVGESLEEEESIDCVGIRFEECGKEVRLREGSRSV
jgi:hypothetical protein